ncbi:phospholipase ABHD3-like [Glandiceps talaboti]
MGYFVELAREWQSLPLVVGFGALCVTYYLNFVAKKPMLVGKDRRFQQFLRKHCPALTEKYWPTFWCFESRANTIIRAVLKSPITVPYRTEKLDTWDGGEICLDWLDNENSQLHRDSKTRPTVLILPGLTGSSSDYYIAHIADDVSKLGYRSVVFNNRGNGGSQLKTPRTYCAANTEDLHFVVNHIKRQYPKSPVVGVGISLGGMILFNYLAKSGQDCGLKAAMVVSTAYNVFKSTKSLETPLNWFIFNQFLTVQLRESVRKNVEMFKSHLDIDHVMKSRSIRDFDERFTSKMFGYEGVEHYYKDASLHEKLDALKIPVLCFQAADDPFSPETALPLEEARQHPNIVFAVTSHGGHIGFCEGLLPRNQSYMERVLFQYVDAVFKYGDAELVEH